MEAQAGARRLFLSRRTQPADDGYGGGGGGEQSRETSRASTETSKPCRLRIKRSGKNKAGDDVQARHHLVHARLDRIEEDAVREEREEKAYAAETKLNDAVRGPATPPARPELAEQRKFADQSYRPEPVRSMAKVHAGNQEPAPSSSYRISSGKKPIQPNHHPKETAPVGTDDGNRNDDEKNFQLGMKALMELGPEALKSEINLFYKIKEQPKSQRIAKKKQRCANKPSSFTFQLPMIGRRPISTRCFVQEKGAVMLINSWW